MQIAKRATVTAAGLLLSLAAWGEPVKNWPVSTTTWRPPASQMGNEGSAAQPAATTPPLSFIGITPCRIVDTRQSTMPPGYGLPMMATGEVRIFPMIGQNHCTIPPEAQAVSLNVTAVNEATDGYVTAYPAGVPTPLVATVVFLHGQTTLNAAIVPLGDGGGLAVKASISLHLVIDVNGYFAPSTGGSSPWSVNGNAVYYNGGPVGVGTSTPSSLPGVKLDIQQGDMKVDPGFGLVGTGGAHIKPGPAGNTFIIQAGIPGASLAIFQDSQGNNRLVIDPNGGIDFTSQKVCTVVGNGRTDLLVPSTWTIATCQGLRGAIGGTMTGLGCVFGNSFSYGSLGTTDPGLPAQNCGW